MCLVIISMNSRGQLGQGHDTWDISDDSRMNEMGDNLADTNLGTDFVVVQLVAGRFHTCALSADFELKCWG